jgi:protein-tyrosine phosphatase
MIDLHAHILPGLDDGPATMDGSISLARAAVAAGTHAVVATPHVRSPTTAETCAIGGAVTAFNDRLIEEDIPLVVLPGAELGLVAGGEMADAALSRVTLGGGPYVLVESPRMSFAAPFERIILDLLRRQHGVVLAHPELCVTFQRQPEYLEALVAQGVLVQITARSLTAAYGRRVRRFALRLLGLGLVHVIASDAHDDVKRPPGLRTAFREVRAALPSVADQWPWLTVGVPHAVLRGRPLPERPVASKRATPRRRWAKGMA